MKITKRQLRRIIREAMSDEEIFAMADKHLDSLGPVDPDAMYNNGYQDGFDGRDPNQQDKMYMQGYRAGKMDGGVRK